MWLLRWTVNHSDWMNDAKSPMMIYHGVGE